MSRIDTSQIRRMFDLAAKLGNPINLSIGQPHYATPPEIIEACSKAMKDGKTAYTPTQGIQPLREAICEKYAQVNGFKAHPEDMLISAGVSSLLLLLFDAVVDPNDRVLLIDPYFLIYKGMLEFHNAKIETLPEDFTSTDSIDPNGLKLIVFSSPSNPSGKILSEEQIKMLAALAEKSGAYLVSDEIYELFDYEKKFNSAAKIYDKAVTLTGFSKSYSMTGLRLSAATGPKELIKAMTTLQQYTVVCAPSAVQWAGIEALKLDMTSYREMYRKNRDYCLSRLQGKVELSSPDGAFYLYANVKEDSEQFVNRAIQEKQLLVVPGHIFSNRRDHVRISYAAPIEVLHKGMDAFLELLA